MSFPRQPEFEAQRQKELEAELLERARAWLPDWQPRASSTDFASALFGIAARIESEVTQRLARVPEKTFLGFLHWLGVRGKPGLAARAPVTFSMTAGSEPVDVPAGIQMQSTPTGAQPVTLETSAPLRILPTRLVATIAADPALDALFLPPLGLANLEAPKTLPTTWQLVSPAALGTRTLQLEPELGLEEEVVLLEPVSRQRYSVVSAERGIVSIDPELGNVATRPGASATAPLNLAAGAVLQRLEVFDPFGDTERNVQEHALYVGAGKALDVEIPTVIEIVGGGTLPDEVEWAYWGKTAINPAAKADWVELKKLNVAGALYLIKPAGALEETKLQEHQSRWLRARRAKGDEATTLPGLQLKVNCPPDGGWPQPVKDELERLHAEVVTTDPAIEGIANTAPLVLSSEFYPLGREPRLFDAFYLGSKEMLSKPAARVRLHFEIGGSFSAPLAGARAGKEGDSGYLVVGVSDDFKLQRLWLSETDATPPAPRIEFLAPAQPTGPESRPLRIRKGFRPGMASIGVEALVSVIADDQVWLFRQSERGVAGGWSPLVTPERHPDDLKNPPDFGDTVNVRGASGLLQVHLLLDGRLYTYRSSWTREDIGKTDDQKKAIPYPIRRLVPILNAGAEAGDVVAASGLACLSAEGKLYFRDEDGNWTGPKNTTGPASKLDSSWYPHVVVDAAGAEIVFARTETGVLSALALVPGGDTVITGKALGHSASSLGAETVRALAVVFDEPTKLDRPLAWEPFVTGAHFFADPPPITTFADGPLVLGDWALIPCENGAVAVAPCFGEVEAVQEASLTDAFIVAEDPTGAELVAFLEGAVTQMLAIAKVLPLGDDHWALSLAAPREPQSEPVAVVAYQRGPVQHGQLKDDKTLTLQAKDKTTQEGDWLELRSQFHRVTSVDAPSKGARTATFEPAVGDPTTGKLDYTRLEKIASDENARLRPLLDTTKLTLPFPKGLRAHRLRFPSLTPELQDVLFSVEDPPGKPTFAVLSRAWILDSEATSPSQADFEVLAPLGAFQKFEPPRARNPELEWEYFDGKSWWKIPGLRDATGNLLNTGDVEFCVPANLQPTEVVGRTNHWVRARLVSGNYGQESVTVLIEDTADKKGKLQTAVRNTDSLRPPYVLKLTPRYEICCPTWPDFVLSKDSANVRELSEANRTQGAVLEFFLPLADSLKKLGNPDDAGAALAGGRALYLGFDAPLSGGPIHVLLLLEDSDDAGYPLRVEALLDERFRRVVSKDETRCLSETGILSFTLAGSLRATSLFGHDAHWLRLRPAAGAQFEAGWRPKIRGIYLNSAWAVAAETQTDELLGSSDGSPAQTLTLARTPVLENTLVLRVREPLGDEEKGELRRTDSDLVLDEMAGRPGPWVRWREVADPGDWPAAERVFSLDSKLGSVTFGNGEHGRIPPVGRDSVLAQRYQRGGGKAANQIRAFDQISLNTPVQGVDAVVLTEGASGGSDPQTAETAVAFAPANLHARERALTAQDLRMLALQASPDIAQVGVTRSAAGVRLIVVMKGRDPLPSNAARRSLRAHLLERALPALAVPGALEIVAPSLIRIRVQLRLTIDDIEQSGDVAQKVAERIATLLDPGRGGHDGQGFRLGDVPTDSDVAASLSDVPHLASVDSCSLQRQSEDGKLAELPSRLRGVELVSLVPDGVSVEFQVEEAFA